MKLFTFVSAFSLSTLIFVGCSDPADKVHKSATSAPAKKEDAVTPPLSGKDYVIRGDISTIGFVGSKVTGQHSGGFKNFSGVISVADGKIIGSPQIKINMKTIWSDNEKLTGHLKSADFFDIEKHPISTFTVTSIESGEPQKITGNLEMHGETKSISFPAKIEISSDIVTINAEFAINRKDFNINYPGKQNDLIRDNVVLNLALEATPGASRPEDQISN